MAFIGNTNTTQAFTPAVDYFSGNASTTAFILSRPVASVAQVQVTVNNVAQNPSSAYTVSSNTITFTSAPLSGTNNIYVYYTSPITQVIAPGQGTVNTTALGNITNIASGNSSLTLQTGSGNTTAVTVDTSQNVGIGITSPTRKLQVKGGTIGVTSNDGTVTNVMDYSSIGTATSSAFTLVTNGADRVTVDSSGNVGIGTSSPSSYGKFAIRGGITASINGTNFSGISFETSDAANSSFYINHTSGYANLMGDAGLTFYTGNPTVPAERMRINTSGQICMATTSAVAPGGPSGQVNILNPNNDGNWALALQNNATTSNLGRGIGIKNNVDFNNASSEFIFCIGSTSPRFFVQSNGGIYNYSGNNVNLSDRREKTNFAPAKSYLNTICAIPVQTFNYVDQNMEEDGGLTLGVVAQDVQAVAPEFVTESNWGTKEEPKIRLSIYEADLKYALMKSIQELKTIVDAQAAEIAELKAKVGV